MLKKFFLINFFKFIIFWTFCYYIGWFGLKFFTFFDDSQLSSIFFFEVSVIDLYPLFFASMQVFLCFSCSEYYESLYDLGIDSGSLIFYDFSVWDDPSRIGFFEGLLKRDHRFLIYFNFEFLNIFYWILIPLLVIHDLVLNLYSGKDIGLSLTIFWIIAWFSFMTFLDDESEVSITEIFDQDDSEILDKDNIETSARWLTYNKVKTKISYQKNNGIYRYKKSYLENTNPLSWSRKKK